MDIKRHFVRMKDAPSDPKRDAILTAAWQAFATYGFRKTSMDDIARGAGVSRPAVYLHFKGKEEVFRALVQVYYDTALAAVAAALDGQGTPADILTAAFEAQAGETLEAMLTSPHGMELLDTSTTTARDLKLAGDERLVALYADWLRRANAAGQILLPGTANTVASTLCAAFTAIKYGAGDYSDKRAQIRTLARLMGDGLTPR
jgi:AcrR family transcriptional regulator